MKRNYELIYVLNPAIGEEAVEAEMERIREIVESAGEIIDVDVWGRRRLAYPIQDETEGHYVVMHFASEPDFPKELERLLRIADRVLRYLIVTIDEA